MRSPMISADLARSCLLALCSVSRVPHEVMPAIAADRYAISVWFGDAKAIHFFGFKGSQPQSQSR